jgi:hypothetical protein
MRHETNLTDDEIDEVKGQIDEVITHLIENWKNIKNKLPWLTTLTKKELQEVEDYYTIKYQVLPSLKSMLQNPTLISYDSIDEILTEGDSNEKRQKRNKCVGHTEDTQKCKNGCNKSCKKSGDATQ